MQVNEAQQIRWYTYRAASRVGRNMTLVAWIAAIFAFANDQPLTTAFLSGSAAASFVITVWLYAESRSFAP